MILHVREAKHLRDYVIWLRFNDGAEGEIDLAGELEGEMFAPLKAPTMFQQLRVDPELQTVVWPNGETCARVPLREHAGIGLTPPANGSRTARQSLIPNP